MRKILLAAVPAALLLAPSAAQADGSLYFLIDGDTFSQGWSITNNSTAGEYVTGFGIDLTGSGFVFDPLNGGPPGNGTNGTKFAPLGGTGATTGLVTPVIVPDGSFNLDLLFTDFDVGESFIWELDVDPNSSTGSPTVLGSDMIGVSVYVDFSNGLRGSGTMMAVAGNSDAAQFEITTITPTPAVPEPSTWAMLIGGLGLAGAMMRRRSARTAVQFA